VSSWLEDASPDVKAEVYEQLLSPAPLPVLIHHNFIIRFINAAGYQLLGAAGPADMIGKTIFEVVDESFHSLARDRIGRALTQGEPTPPMRQRFIRLDGERIPVEVTGWAIPFGEGAGILVTFADMSEREAALRSAVEAAERLRSSEARLALAQSAAQIGVWDWNIVDDRSICTPEYFSLYGLPKRTIDLDFGRWLALIHPDDQAGVRANTEKALLSGTEYSVEFRVIWPDQSLHWLASKGRIFRNRVNRAIRVIGVNIDVTERKQLQEQFLQAQKMEAVGRLAGGVAHDFNNLLTVILGYTTLIQQAVSDNPTLTAQVRFVKEAAELGAGLTGQLLAFSRKQIIQPRYLDLNTIVLELEPMLRRTLGEDIIFSIHLADNPVTLRADSTQMTQMIMNLVVNARDAMPQGGQLILTTELIEMDENSATTLDISPGRFALLTVRDTGMGMDEQVRLHIFEPFFTTKPVGTGTGLGLSTVYGIVQQNGGTINVESRPNAGTTFSVFLPNTNLADDISVTESLPIQRRGTGTILLVEDERAVRVLSATVLREAGYEVLEAENGHEALTLADEFPGRISLLLTDVVMRGMSGVELAEQLIARHPGIPILYASGFIEHALLIGGELERGTRFLQKPFSPASLSQAVAALITQ
jgi:two-component system cell cycle sensor histidine kinase/response regulator CckA